MRLFIDVVIAMALMSALVGILWQQRVQAHRLDRVHQLQQQLRSIESQALYHAAVGDAEAASSGFALRVEPSWFETGLRHPLLDRSGPLRIETVPKERRDRFNPLRITTSDGRAAFWYNPYRGRVRARIPMQLSEDRTVKLYNMINGTSLRVRDVRFISAEGAASPSASDASTDGDESEAEASASETDSDGSSGRQQAQPDADRPNGPPLDGLDAKQFAPDQP